jgi:hypothetical protein
VKPKNEIMALDNLKTLEVIEAMENFLSNVRPPEHIREELDAAYKIEDQSVIVFEIRLTWTKPKTKVEIPIAKATFVKAKNIWKVYWKRSNGKWESYGPKPLVKKIKQFADLIEEDSHSCFFG